MNAETIKVRLIGDRPLLMHSGRLADPLDDVVGDLAKITGKRSKTRADHEEIARIEWHGGLWLSDSRPCIPAEAVEACFINAARARKKAKQARAGLMVMGPSLLNYDGPRDLDRLWKNQAFRLKHAVRIGTARTMRTRPRFETWSADVSPRSCRRCWTGQKRWRSSRSLASRRDWETGGRDTAGSASSCSNSLWRGVARRATVGPGVARQGESPERGCSFFKFLNAPVGASEKQLYDEKLHCSN